MVCGVSVNKKFVGSNVGIEKRSRNIEKRSRSNKKRSRSYREASLYIKRNLKNRISELNMSYQIYATQGEILLGFVFKEILISSPKKFLTSQMHVIGLQKILELSFSLSSTDVSSERELRNLLLKNSPQDSAHVSKLICL